MADAAARIAQLQAELQQLRAQQEAHQAEIAGLREREAALADRPDHRDARLAASQQREAALRDQLTITAEVLRVMATPGQDLHTTLRELQERARLLLGAAGGQIYRIHGEVMHRVPVPGVDPTDRAWGERPLNRFTIAGRAVLDRRPHAIGDIQDPNEAGELLPSTRTLSRQIGIKSILAVPLLHGDEAIGAIQLYWLQVRRLSTADIGLLETFADQAVIAIENARLFEELERRNRELNEALEQQTATAEVLRVIASAPTETQQALDAITATAARVCGADSAALMRSTGTEFFRVSFVGPLMRPSQTDPRFPIDATSMIGHALMEQRSIHVDDIQGDEGDAYPASKAVNVVTQARTCLVTPLVQDGRSVGAILIRRGRVEPFTEKQIALLETFADQAVIAIENARLFEELERRNRELAEALEQQTATAHILRVIATSPTDLQPVLDAIAENGARLCEAPHAEVLRVVGDSLQYVAGYGMGNETVGVILPISRGSMAGRAVLDRKTHYELDRLATREVFPDSPMARLSTPPRTMIATPLLREGEAIGALVILRVEVRPFTDEQMGLVETFADQAVIAIENARLFEELERRNRELNEALEQQTATADILRVIAASPMDIQRVLDAIADITRKLCGADAAWVQREVDGHLRTLSGAGGIDQLLMPGAPNPNPPMNISRDSISGRAVVDRATIHVADIETLATEMPVSFQNAQRFLRPYRAQATAPLLHGENVVGTLSICNFEPGAFSDERIRLLETFADQAAIAIENTRLFEELERRNAELQESNRQVIEALEQQTATADILRVIASSPTELQVVLDTIVEVAVRLTRAHNASIAQVDEPSQMLVPKANYGPGREIVERWVREHPERRSATRPLSRELPSGRAFLERRTIRIDDAAEAVKSEYPAARERQEVVGQRSEVTAPLLRGDEAIGVLGVQRFEVQPFTDREVEVLEAFADQAVIAIENARLFQELQDSNRQVTEALEQQTALGEVLRVIASSPHDLRAVLGTIAQSAAHLTSASHASVWRLDGDLVRLSGRWTVDGKAALTKEQMREHTRPLDRTIGVSRVILDRTTLRVDDVLEHLDRGEIAHPGSRELVRQTAYRSLAVAPLLLGNAAIGAISVMRNEIRPFDNDDVALLESFADQAVIAIENARLFQELQTRVGELQALGDVGQAVSSSLDLAEVLTTIVANATRLAGADAGVIYEYDDMEGVFEVRAEHQMTDDLVAALRTARFRLGEGALGRAGATQAPLQIENLETSHVLSSSVVRERMLAQGIRSVLAVPLLREDRVLGGLVIVRRTLGAFPDEERPTIGTT